MTAGEVVYLVCDFYTGEVDAAFSTAALAEEYAGGKVHRSVYEVVIDAEARKENELTSDRSPA